MKRYFFNEVDSENIDIAKKIIEDSDNLKADGIFDDNLMNNIENKRKTEKKVSKKVFAWSSSIAACITILAVIGVFWNHTDYRTDDRKMNKSQIYQEDSSINISDKAIPNTVSIAADYSQIYERMRYVGKVSYGEQAEMSGSSDGAVKKSESALVNRASMDTQSAGNMSSEDFYDTNEQTEGVHEGDVVKTDGKYIYTLKCVNELHDAAYKIFITKADGKKLKNVSNFSIRNSKGYCYDIEELYLDGDRLLAVGMRYLREYSDDKDNYSTFCYDACYEYNPNAETVIFTYDISDRSNPSLISENIQEGSYVDSRLSDGFIYTISDKYMGKISKEDCVPKVNGKCVSPNDVYLPEKIDDREYTVITALDLMNAGKYAKTVSVAGGASNIYVSSGYIYVIENTREEEDISDTKKGKGLLKKSFIRVYDDKEYSLSKKEKKNVKAAYDGVKDVSARINTMACKATDSIHILKYSYNKEKVDFVAEQTVKGRADDNMLFDEKDGYLRFVTTEETDFCVSTKISYYDQNHKLIYSTEEEGDWIDSTDETNNLFVLDEKLNVKAQINGLAKRESVYAARYMGDYGYFVTYENTDPLFTVDFSDMENPKIIGELKMPGYSQYLHFYTEDKLFGIGMDTDEKSGEWNGLKIEMYDISGKNAVSEAKNIFKNIDGSEVLYNYKALMIDSKKGLIGFSGEKSVNDYEYMKTFYYLYTYKNGKFKELAAIDLKYDYSNVRGLYINDYIYIVVPFKKILVLNPDDYKISASIDLK